MKKRIYSFALILAILVTVMSGMNTVYAYSKSEMDKKIQKTESEIADLKKKLSQAKAKEKKESAGTEGILYGSVISNNPLIVSCTGIFGGTTYYWIEDDRYLDNLLGVVNGVVKPTGKYRQYNGYTCAVAKSVKVTNNSQKYEKQIKKKKDDLDFLKAARKNYVCLKNVSIETGKSKSVNNGWKYVDKYNYHATWTSSNKKVATVDRNGKVTAKKAGKTTISAKCNESGIVKKCVVTVTKPVVKIDSLYTEQNWFVLEYNEWKGKVFKIPLEIMPKNAEEKYKVTIKKDKNISQNEKESSYKTLAFNIDKVGIAEVQIKMSSGDIYSIIIVVYDKNDPDSLQSRLLGGYTSTPDINGYSYDVVNSLSEENEFSYLLMLNRNDMGCIIYSNDGNSAKLSDDTISMVMRGDTDFFDSMDSSDLDPKDRKEDILPLSIKLYLTKTSDGIKIKIVDENDETIIYDEVELQEMEPPIWKHC